MGYIDEETVYKLTFPDGKREGLEVRTTSVATGDLLKIIKLAAQVQESKDAEASIEVIEDLLSGFAEALVSWNIEQRVDGEVVPVPATLAGLKSRRLDLVIEVIYAWIEAVSGTPGDLGKGSVSGVTFPEGSTTTAAQLASLSNSLTPG
jgi:hypothetical protein